MTRFLNIYDELLNRRVARGVPRPVPGGQCGGGQVTGRALAACPAADIMGSGGLRVTGRLGVRW